VGYWCVARSEPSRESAAAHFLALAGYGVYLPRVHEQRTTHGRRYAVTAALFTNYLFVRIEVGWWSARWACGVSSLIMDGPQPARLADAIVSELKGRERKGVIVLPEERSLPGRVTGSTSYVGPWRGWRACILGCGAPTESRYCSAFLGLLCCLRPISSPPVKIGGRLDFVHLVAFRG
jgi:hypothetical protein